MAGTYSDIVEIVAPASAIAGSTVNVAVKIKNSWPDNLHVYCVAVLDSEERFINWREAWVGPAETRSFYGAFVMPEKEVRINAYSYFEGDDGYLYLDDSKSKDVRLAELAPQVSQFSIVDYVKV